MKKRLSTYILLYLFTQSVLKVGAQNIDSLKQALSNAKVDTARCNILNELAETASDKEWPIFNEQLLKLCKTCLLKLGNQNKKNKKFYLHHLAAALNNFGFLADNQGDMIKALDYYHSSLRLQEEINDKQGMATSLNNIGLVFKNQGDILKALEYYHRSLKILENINDKLGAATTLSNIGVIYMNQGEISKALEYYYNSLKIREEIKHKFGIAYSLNNIGAILLKKGDVAGALGCFERSLKIREEIKDIDGIAGSLNNIGGVYKNQGKIEQALGFLQRSLKIREGLNDQLGIASSLNNIGNILLIQKNINGALSYTKRSLKIAKELGYPENIKLAASTLKNIYKTQNNFKEGLEMYELEIMMHDSINNTETKKASIKKQFQYQYEKKAATDSVKNQEAQKVKNAQLLTQQAQLNQERTQRFALYGGLILVIAFSGFVFNRFKITQKQKFIIESQKEQVDKAYGELHKKNKEITDSIIYASRIQRALITSEKYLAMKLNQLLNKT